MNDVTLSRVNLFAVLRTLELLPTHDAQAKELIRGAHETIQFTSPKGIVRLAINDGTITHHVGAGPNTINLAFPTPKAVNKMFDGTGNPIPLKGLRKLDFLKGPFTKLTERLTYFLIPTPAALADPAYALANAEMTLHLAVYALAEIGNFDPIGQVSATRIADGDIQVAVRGGAALAVRASGGKLRVTNGLAQNRRAKMIFADLDSAGAVLRGELSSYAAIGRDLIELGGYVPMLDNFNKLLSLVPRYLG